MSVELTGILLAALLAVALLLLFSRLIARKPPDWNPEWIRTFSIEKYRPMQRLLSEEDYRFLEAQPGYRPEIAARLRKSRRRVFRAYLRSLTRDFDRLYAAARLMVLYAPEDRSALAWALLRQRVIFRLTVARVELRLILHGFGLGEVNVSALIEPIQALQNRISTLAAASAA